MARLTQLQAVNIVLRAAREQPVSSLDEDTINEVLTAIQILDEWDLRVQSDGLFVNTFQEELTPDATTDKIDVNPNILFITAWGRDLQRNVDMRPDGGVQRLYDVDNQTFDWSDRDGVYVKYYLRVDFEDDLTFAQQDFITREAAREYQMDTVGSNSMDNLLSQRAARARAKARRENVVAKKANQFTTGRSNMARAAARSTFRSWYPDGHGRHDYNDRNV